MTKNKFNLFLGKKRADFGYVYVGRVYKKENTTHLSSAWLMNIAFN